ncbi:hypothetical protein KIN20_022539 [Parelaphostrongylus tenuis]|uniref:Uncharacterized protein n=1 Tax=Parelaphostrongylus tenuis TaxID=148309 RepID=A0AAD5QV95_PARTN|nr:hypothetical protein KIN20_022539 [Parelaphostrongylus tenuis]
MPAPLSAIHHIDLVCNELSTPRCFVGLTHSQRRLIFADPEALGIDQPLRDAIAFTEHHLR